MKPGIPAVSLYGVPFSKLNFKETVDLLVQTVEAKMPAQVITANPIMVMKALEDPAYMAMMQRAEVIVPDGAGVVWATGYIGKPVAEKVAGIELMHELFRIGEERGWRVYLLGTAPDTIRIAVEKLRERYPKLILAGYRDGYFKADQDQEVLSEIQQTAPDLLFVGRGADTQEPWIDRYKEELGVPLVMGVGGSLDILAGKLKRAPKWMIKLRLEWFYRLAKEPTRYKRMLVLPKFALKVMRDREKLQ
ncbi:WecB/TagA/CpsF family glycosyltransferase [Gorillibacterium timonense]|uniref:WecB/TagA/CpsF family glycosyltransferase n=1 Tax=Gorillibacterium timonense TaxID=1689269 RepID=UPI00071D1355|nr:WecB/TagA/CpsF family glycosyltransferase [Gorillibacterium timonense]